MTRTARSKHETARIKVAASSFCPIATVETRSFSVSRVSTSGWKRRCHGWRASEAQSLRLSSHGHCHGSSGNPAWLAMQVRSRTSRVSIRRSYHWTTMAAQARSICVDKRSCVLLRLIQRRRRFAAALLPRLFGNNVPGRTTRAPPVGFELATTGIQFYAKFATLSESPASPGLREFAAALITTTVREQHPRSRHKGATSMQTHPAVR